MIVLDLGMPPGEMDGMEFLTRLRESGAAQTPVVILSAIGDVMNRDVAARLGVHAVLETSSTPGPQLVEIVRRILGRGSRGLPTRPDGGTLTRSRIGLPPVSAGSAAG